MPLSIIRGTVNGVNKTDTFTYGPEHQRLKQVATLPSSSGTLTTLYLAAFEQETNSDTGAVDYKYYLSAGGRSLGVFVDRYTTAAPGGTPTDVRYFHQDQLGSVVAVTDFNGAAIELLNYDAFGKRRNPDGTDSTNTLLPQNDRGYTGHEMLDTVGLIHMNGRIYDPTLGRFMSADPYIQAPGMTLSYNRYVYVMNDPFVLTDPSGYSWLSKTWKKAWHNQYVRTAIAIVVAYYTGQYVGVELGGGAIAGGAAGGFAGSLVASGGDFKAAAQGALTGALMGWAGGYSDLTENYAAHAVAGCISGAIDGGADGCGRGAAAAVVGKFITDNTPNDWGKPGQFAATVVGGGTTSVITGGKFANGAMTSAYGYLFNYCFHEGDCDDLLSESFHKIMATATDAVSEVYKWWSGASLVAMGPLGEVGPALAVKGIANPVSGTLARVVPRGLNPTTLGKAGEADVFVTNASELRGLSNAQIADKLTIPNVPGGFKVLEFPSSSVNGIASPVLRTNPGFVGGGKTAGEAAEFVIPNGPIPPGTTQWIPH